MKNSYVQRAKNRIKIVGDHLEIQLTRGYIAYADLEDYEKLVGVCWQVLTYKKSRTPYALSGNKHKHLRKTMHRHILGVTARLVFIDHIDLNGLNNRRSNLRVATPQQSTGNRRSNPSSGYRGVKKRSRCNSWKAKIVFQNRGYELGTYPDIRTAAKAYDIAAKVVFGEFARLNFPGRAFLFPSETCRKQVERLRAIIEASKQQ